MDKNILAIPYNFGRSAVFTLESLSLPILDYLINGQRRPLAKDFQKFFKKAQTEANKLIWQDSQNIIKGIYPISVLKPESPIKHLLRIPNILWDAYKISKRRNKKISKEFSAEAREHLDELPEYFKRNFHFQTDGYLSQESAELYEHQVEMLFAGTADAMRRLIIPQVKKHLGKNIDGRGLRILEVACGTGRLTQFMAQSFPKAQILATDISPVYLKHAKNQLKNFGRVDFMRADGTETRLQDEQFDLVYSCFLFHELPMKERVAAIQEAKRVLKPGGYFGFVDSIQQSEAEELSMALEMFPVDFHEPFYKDYSQNPMEILIENNGLEIVEKSVGFFSKAILARK